MAKNRRPSKVGSGGGVEGRLRIKPLLDGYGVIYDAAKILPDEDHRLKFLAALAELEDNECHRTKNFPKTRLHRVQGIEEAVYRADIDKLSGWRLHVQYAGDGQLHLKDIVPGQRHDDVVKVIKGKKSRFK